MTEPYLIYIDADSVLDQDFQPDLQSLMDNHGVLLVEQSVSWRPQKLRKKIRFYLLHPGAIFADPKKLLLEGGLGTWEKNPLSKAFVPRSERTHYVSGAVFMGAREPISEMVSELAERVEDDWNRGIVARWHDESHLNWWAARYRPKLLDPRYYFFPGHHHLDELPSIIRLIAKPLKTR